MAKCMLTSLHVDIFYLFMLQIENIVKHIILPSSFVGSPRDMNQCYQDAMSLVKNFGKPYLFLTMTCNPSWEEIKKELLEGETSHDHLDLLTRILSWKS